LIPTTIKKRILGVDYGSKRIGIAISDPLNIIARGLKVLSNSPHALTEIKCLALEYEVELIVVGMPLNLKGERGQKGDEVTLFVNEIKNATGLEIVEWDERFSSHTAHQTLREMGVKKRQRQSKEKIDEMAAAIILQGYLDSQKTTPHH
jgi:putative Holliday junction resolvase